MDGSQSSPLVDIVYIFLREERDEGAFEGLLKRLFIENWAMSLHILLVSKPGKWWEVIDIYCVALVRHP